MRRSRRDGRTTAVVAGLTAVALLAGGGAPALAQDAGDDSRAGVRQALDRMVDSGVPGVLARVDDADGPWVGTSGVADLESGDPVPSEGRFRAASLTKSIVATVVVQLAEEGELDLDAPVGDWLPGLVTGADEITVRQLLNHTGGLSDYLEHEEFDDPEEYSQRTYQPAQLVDHAEEVGPVGPPGEEFSYSNTGYVVLGMLVEEITGGSLEAEIDRRVLGPAGMTRSYLPVTDAHIDGPHARGYYLPDGADPERPDALRDITELNPSFAWAAYGLVSDARDLNRFYRALFDGRLVSSASLDQMLDGVATPQAPIFPEYGLGLEAVALSCTTVWGATGSIPGYQTYSFADDSGAITLSTNVQRTDPAAGELIVSALDALNHYFCDTGYPGIPEPAEETPAPTGADETAPRAFWPQTVGGRQLPNVAHLP